MSSLGVVVGSIWIAIVFVSHGIWSATALPVERTEIVVSPDQTETLSPGMPQRRSLVSDFDAPRETFSGDHRPSRVDMYGNEVERALTDYRIDVRGDIYERHHPQTALPEPVRPST